MHHSYYEKGLAPWEYPDESLHCLCEDCHKQTQDLATLLQRAIGKRDLGDHEILLGYALGLETLSYPMAILDVFSYEVAMGIGHCWELTPEEVIEALQEGQIGGYTLEKLRQISREKRTNQNCNSREKT